MYEEIKRFCDDVKITIAEFERICGFSKGYVCKLDRISPSAKAVKRISQVMGVSVDTLMEMVE